MNFIIVHINHPFDRATEERNTDKNKNYEI